MTVGELKKLLASLTDTDPIKVKIIRGDLTTAALEIDYVCRVEWGHDAWIGVTDPEQKKFDEPIVVDLHRDETNVRYVIGLTGKRSGEDLGQLKDRDEHQAFDTYKEARQVTDWLVERLRKRGYTVIDD